MITTFRVTPRARPYGSRTAEEEEHDDEDHDEDEHDHEDEEEAFGTLENSATETKSLTGGISYIGERGHFGIAVQRFETDYGIPGGHGHGHEDEGHDDEGHDDEDEEHSEEEEELVTIGLEQTRVDINASLNLDGFIETLQLFGGYADYEHTEFEGSEVGLSLPIKAMKFAAKLSRKSKRAGVALMAYKSAKESSLRLGMKRSFRRRIRTNMASILSKKRKWATSTLEGAVRFERTDQENAVTGETVSFGGFSVSAGGDFHLSDAVRMGGTVFRHAAGADHRRALL